MLSIQEWAEEAARIDRREQTTRRIATTGILIFIFLASMTLCWCLGQDEIAEIRGQVYGDVEKVVK